MKEKDERDTKEDQTTIAVSYNNYSVHFFMLPVCYATVKVNKEDIPIHVHITESIDMS